MHPEILRGIFADHVLDGRGISLRDVAKRVVLILPVLWMDDVLRANLEVERPIGPPRKADDHWNFILHRQQADRLIRAGLSPEEIDEQALAAGVLIGDET